MKVSENVVGASLASGTSGTEVYSDLAHLRAVVRRALESAGVAPTECGAFGSIVPEGATVLLKPNWVLHFNKGGHGMDCMITHPSLIEAVLSELKDARPGRIILGDAPIQRTVFEEVAPPELFDRWMEASGRVPLEVRDFRSTVCHPGTLSLRTSKNEERLGHGILFDVGYDSLLEELAGGGSRFRNTSYDHGSLEETHSSGKHQYLVCPEVIESDVVIGLPKLKSHRKAGITGALKNLVGINQDKDFLPHHRSGGSADGGDCYEGRNRIKKAAELFVDHANRRIDSVFYAPWHLGSLALMAVNKVIHGETQIEGGWYGNDTVWRMVLDLNRIILYGTKDGRLAERPQRTLYSLTDAVVVGEGLGPLAPSPRLLNMVTFASSSAAADLIHALLMGFDWKKIPLVAHAFDQFRFPLTSARPDAVKLCLEGREYSQGEICEQLTIRCKPAPGWAGHIELAGD